MKIMSPTTIQSEQCGKNAHKRYFFAKDYFTLFFKCRKTIFLTLQE